MSVHHGTYIIGFSAASKHMAMAPEHATTIRFDAARHGLIVRLLGGPPLGNHGRPPFRTLVGGAASNIKNSITTRAADVHGRC